jgi:deoxyribodipyrimidine photo-lyase
MTKKTIFWFRQDLRLEDNLGLYEAAENGEVMAVYIFDEDEKKDFKMGAASRWWLHHCLSKLNQKLDNKLNIYHANSKDIILKLVKENNIDAVYWNRCYEPSRIKDDSKIKLELKNIGIDCQSFKSSLLFEPWEITKDDGTYYKVFTPFYQKGYLKSAPPRPPLPIPEKLNLIKEKSHSIAINQLNLLGGINWYCKMEKIWKIGEDAAKKRFDDFLKNGLENYKEGRNFPAKNNVSALSPHLHFGEISPNYIWHKVQDKNITDKIPSQDINHFLSEIAWREFSYYLLYHFPNLPRQNFQPRFDQFPWQKDEVLLKAWQKGQTGYPIIDAGMRQLWQTGYMHNRVRMITGSFLVKNLLLHWHDGAQWFWDCLVDADLANNSASWQWIAGSGADAAPYFRIFNPLLQAEKFDPTGTYIKHFVPELKNMPIPHLFKPWQAPESILQSAKVTLGKNYPKPIVDLSDSRNLALQAYKFLRNDNFLG